MKLLNKTIRSYLVYSFIILLITVPLFYLVVKRVLLHSVDRSLRIQLRDIRANLGSIHTSGELQIWSELDKDISLYPADHAFSDSIYTEDVYNRHHHNADPYRKIAGFISVDAKPYRLVISSSLVENEDLLGSIVLVQAAMLVLLMAGLLLINRNISRKIWQPFYDTLNRIQEYQLNKNTPIFFPDTSTDEFNKLNSAVKNLLDRNYEIYLQQKEFTENASHEMQTPIAIFQSQLELLMQTSPLNEQQATLINALETTNQRLIRLNKSLLMLTRIENKEYTPTDSIDISSLLARLTDSFRYYIDKNNIRLTEHFNSNPVLHGNPTLLEILGGNLLSNAIRHNTTNGQLIIEVQERSFSIKNSGSPVALAADRIFNRFYKDSNHPESTGLGLALVKRICRLYGYAITYSFEDGMHVFTVVFA